MLSVPLSVAGKPWAVSMTTRFAGPIPSFQSDVATFCNAVCCPQVVAFLPPGLNPSGATASSAGGHQQWLLFDSHPRPQLGLTGAYVQIFDRKQALVEALSNIFPAVDVGTDSIMASMYNMVDGTPLTLKQAAPG